MKKLNNIEKILIFIIFIVLFIFLIKINLNKNLPNIINLGNFESVTFNERVPFDFGIEENRWTPDKKDIELAESLIVECKKTDNLMSDKEFSNYIFQYFGLLEGNEKLIKVNAFQKGIKNFAIDWQNKKADMKTQDFQKNLFFNITINLNKKTCSQSYFY